MLAHPARQGDPIALTVNFAGPIAHGPFDVEATAVRTNRSTQLWSMQLRQGSDVVATATAVLATRRETWSFVEAGFPQAPPADTIACTPPLDRVRWTSAYDMRFVQGLLQIDTQPAGERDSVSLLWVHHSDRGLQYAGNDYREKLQAPGITVSMSRKRDFWNNAPMESVNGTLKVECVNDEHFATREQARREIVEYIGYYNTECRHSPLGYVTPAEFERRWHGGSYQMIRELSR